MHAYYADHFVLPLPDGHRFPMAKYRLLRDRLEQQLPQALLQVAPPASDAELALAHTPGYIQAMRWPHASCSPNGSVRAALARRSRCA